MPLPGPFYLIVLFAFLSEAVTGFGSTVISVTLGAHLLPLEQLLPIFVPANMTLSVWILAKNHQHIDRRFLLKRMLPTLAIGMAIGLTVLSFAPPGPGLLIGYAAFVAVLATVELLRKSERAPSPEQSALALVGGGIVHGLYGSGGPLIVWASATKLANKSMLRATLAAVWLLLNTALLLKYASMGRLSGQTLLASASLLPVVALALYFGEYLHRWVPAAAFKRLVYVLLLSGALSLLIRTALKN